MASLISSTRPGDFADVVGGAAGFHGLHGGFVVIHRGNQNDGGVGRNLVGVAQHFDAVDVRHLDVGDDHVVRARYSILRLAASPRIYGFDFVAFAAQGDVEHFADGALVIADQDVTHARAPLSQLLPAAAARLMLRWLWQRRTLHAAIRRRRSTNVLPWPSLERAQTLPSCACTI